MKIVLPLVIPGQNKRERWHWTKQREEVGAWCIRFRATCHNPATGKRIVKITSYRRRLFSDHANLVGGCKGPIDGLVRAGLLVDDSIKWMTAEYHQESAKESPLGKGVVCTVIEIEEA